MRKIILFSLLAWGLSFSALALPVPDGKAALVEAVIGKVTADQGQGFKKLKLGQDLAPGSSVKTGANGRVSLRLPDGSVARIASNTEMTLKAPEGRKGIFTRMFKGTVRFLVAKQTAGNSFETELPSAVAAVKGTDPEYSTDGTVTTAKVFSSGNPVALLFTDTKSGKETELKAGEKLTFDGDSFKLEMVVDKDREDSDKNYQGLPEVKIEGGEEAKEGEGGTQNTQGGQTTQEGNTTEGQGSGEALADTGLEDVTEEAMQEATADLYLDGFLERDERTGDIAAGKIVYDRFGQRVQVSHFITRPQDDKVVIASYSKRDGGPNKGTSSAIETTKFFAALPHNWGEVYMQPYDPQSLEYPANYLVNRDFVALNPFGDSVEVITNFQAPVWPGDGGGLGTITGPLVQPKTVSLYITTADVPTAPAVFSYTLENTYGASAVPHVLTGDLYVNSVGWNTTASPLEGGWSFAFGDCCGGNFLTQDMHVLDNNGNVLTYFDSKMPPTLPADFRGIDANIEMTLHSPLFDGRSIDLMFLPGWFDLYQMLDLPTANQGGA
jgi:hypothetical protein